MNRTFIEALANRRSYYGISNRSPITAVELEKRIQQTIENLPSTNNSQSTRLVLLYGENHQKLWDIVKEVLRNMMKPDKSFERTEKKINAFAAGYASVLFYEDMKIVEALQEQFPTYATRYPIWSEHTSAMHQIAVWTLLEDSGFGASLQHYNPIIDDLVQKQFDIPEKWHLIAQMPFGIPTETPGEKTVIPPSEKILIFR
ncbi:MAG: nitroreductase family protein [Lentimicrobiaceae bacterium]|jgi:predicted oxidoreductase (fatty acid repression mutant protein)|nr:nitroreductase family protein [Lentimicrobiaceae bacterium]